MSMCGADGRPAAIPFGSAQTAPDRRRKSVAAEIRLTATGTLAMRGPMVPKAAFPPGAERSRSPHLRVTAADENVDGALTAIA